MLYIYMEVSSVKGMDDLLGRASLLVAVWCHPGVVK